MLRVLPKTKSNNQVRFIFFSSLLCLFFCQIGKAQPGNYSDRALFFDQLEERARSLSEKLAAYSNPDFNSSGNETENYMFEGGNQYVTDFNASFVQVRDGNDTNFTTEEKITEVDLEEYSEKISMESQIGRYYIQPFIGMSVPPHQINYTGLGEPVKIKTEIGYAVGLRAGRRWGNFETELHYGYINTEFKKLVSPSLIFGTQDTSGQSELFNCGARIGYGLPFGNNGWFRFASGIGLVHRKDILNLNQFFEFQTVISSENIFSYDVLFSLGYEMKKGLDMFMAYRFLGQSAKGDFDEATMHLLEFGLGANF